MGWMALRDSVTDEEVGMVGDSAWDAANVAMDKLRKEIDQIYQKEWERDATDLEFVHILGFVCRPVAVVLDEETHDPVTVKEEDLEQPRTKREALMSMRYTKKWREYPFLRVKRNKGEDLDCEIGLIMHAKGVVEPTVYLGDLFALGDLSQALQLVYGSLEEMYSAGWREA